MEHVEERVNDYFSQQIIPLPESLASRVLDPAERQALIAACYQQLMQGGEPVQNALTVIEEFARFCTLLAKPENQIQVPTGQYIERAYNTRTFADMEVEMAWVLANLPKHTAYVKVTQEKQGKQVVLKRKIQTYPLPPWPAGRDPIVLERFIVDRSYSLYYQKREQIEKEIGQRQKDGLAGIVDTPPPTHTGNKNDLRSASEGATSEPQAKLIRSDKPSEQDVPPDTSST